MFVVVGLFFFIIYILGGLDILFSSNHNIHKSSCGLFIWTSDPLIDRLLLKNKGHTKFYECFHLTKKKGYLTGAALEKF